jgi:hypothetical protein
MKHRIATLAAAVLLVGGATMASTAAARDNFSIAIGAPGFGIGYSNHGYGYGYVAPPAVYAPPVAYYGAPAYSYYPAPVYYGPRVVYAPYYRAYHHRYYPYRRW